MKAGKLTFKYDKNGIDIDVFDENGPCGYIVKARPFQIFQFNRVSFECLERRASLTIRAQVNNLEKYYIDNYFRISISEFCGVECQ